MGMVFQKNQPAMREMAEGLLHLDEAGRFFSLGMLNIKPSLQMDSMEYSGFQQSLFKREFSNILESIYLMVIFSEYDGKPNPREPLEF